jgi:hypothetical protein
MALPLPGLGRAAIRTARDRVRGETGEPMNLLIAHFKGPPVLARGQHFKSDEKPALSGRESFEEAVRNSGLTPEQQSYLLGL